MTFEEFVLENGFHADDFTPGIWHRCVTESRPNRKKGSYKLSQNLTIGWIKDWYLGETKTWKAEGTESMLKTETRALNRVRLETERVKQQDAIARAKAHYEASKPIDADGHPYLDSKGLTIAGCTDLRVDAQEALLIPLSRNEQMISLQRIFPDGKKLFWKDAPTKGACYTFGQSTSTTLVLCEGFATGLTLFHAMPDSRIVICFSASNLGEVAKTIRHQGLAVIAADHDHQTAKKMNGKNPGLEAAKNTSEKFGFGIAYPRCAGTDWNDYFCERMNALYDAELLKRHRQSNAALKNFVREEIRMKLIKNMKMVVL